MQPQQILDFLKGKKTFIIASIGAVYAIGIRENVWQHAEWLDVLLASLGVAFMRAGITKTRSRTQVPSKLLLCFLLVLLTSCAHFKIDIGDVSTTATTNNVTTTRSITTKLKGTAWFSSAQTLARLKATQTDKSQSFGADGINQRGATNVLKALEHLDNITQTLAK